MVLRRVLVSGPITALAAAAASPQVFEPLRAPQGEVECFGKSKDFLYRGTGLCATALLPTQCMREQSVMLFPLHPPSRSLRSLATLPVPS